MCCTEEEEAAIDSMIKAFRERNRMTLKQLMEVDSMNLDRFAYGRKDPQDVLVPVAEERPYLYRSQKQEELMKKIDPEWRPQDDE